LYKGLIFAEVFALIKKKEMNPRKETSKKKQSQTFKQPLKSEMIFIPLTRQEKQEWNREAQKHAMKLAPFVRFCVWSKLHPSINQEIDPRNQDELWDQFKTLYQKLDTLTTNRDLIDKEIEELRVDNRSLEDKIQANLIGRALNLRDISDYCKEKSENVLESLKKMQEKGIVNQDRHYRWSLSNGK
jgi:hypothetical protein